MHERSGEGGEERRGVERVGGSSRCPVLCVTGGVLQASSAMHQVTSDYNATCVFGGRAEEALEVASEERRAC